MNTSIFIVSEYIVNSFIYCYLILNAIKQTCSIKSLIKREAVELWFSSDADATLTFFRDGVKKLKNCSLNWFCKIELKQLQNFILFYIRYIMPHWTQ
jgi:hypothetical protein